MDPALSGSEIIRSFLSVLPYLNVIFEDDISYALLDTEKYLISKDSRELQLGVKAGDPIQEGGAIVHLRFYCDHRIAFKISDLNDQQIVVGPGRSHGNLPETEQRS